MDYLWAAEAGSASEGGGYWQLAMVMAAIGFLGLFSRWRKARSASLPSSQELRERDENPNRYRDSADKAIVELLETSRTLNAQVDTKIRILNRLVKEAEEQTAKLERLLTESKNMAEPASNAPTTTIADASAEPQKESKPQFMSELQERIYLLAKEGKTTAEIAKATNLSTTEVKFIVTHLNALQDAAR